jgi:hypothetical protein
MAEWRGAAVRVAICETVASFLTIGSLVNSGKIVGGDGGGAGLTGAPGGAGVYNSGAITTLTSSGAIRGGDGGSALVGGAGGAGIADSGTIARLTNSGTISGGNGGAGNFGSGGAGGAGIWNAGAIGPLANSGTIEGGIGGKGAPSGAAGDAIYSAGPHASIGPITNTGRIIGNVEIDNQASVTVNGGTGKSFGSWTGGTITIGNGDLTFVSGNTALGDDISVNRGNGTVTNKGPLQIAALAPLTITGNFTQAAAGVLGLDFAGDASGQYGALGEALMNLLIAEKIEVRYPSDRQTADDQIAERALAVAIASRARSRLRALKSERFRGTFGQRSEAEPVRS